MKADKGNAMVIMDTKYYKDKMHNHLMNGGCCRKLNKYPSANIIQDMMRDLQASSWDEVVKKKIIPRNTIVPRIYGLPKIHKEGDP